MFWYCNILVVGCIDLEDIFIFENSCDFILIKNEVIFFRIYMDFFLIEDICFFGFNLFVFFVCFGKFYI